MSLVTGNYYDLAFWNMGVWYAEISFHLSGPATEIGGEKRLLSGSKKHSTLVTRPESTWAIYAAATTTMAQDRFYRVRATYLDGENNPIGFEEFPWEVRIPEGAWNFADLVRDWSNPTVVGIDTAPPELSPAFWLNPVTGDLSQKD